MRHTDKTQIESRRVATCRRGVATVMAIVLIGVVAVVLAAVSASAVTGQRRTAMTSADAQASQLLAAAAQIARQQRSDGRPVNGPVEMPVGRVTLTWSGAVCDVDAFVDGTGRHVALTFDGARLVHVNEAAAVPIE